MRNKQLTPTGRRPTEPEFQVLPPVRPPARIIMHANMANQPVADIRNVVISGVRTDRDGNLHLKIDEIIDVTAEDVTTPKELTDDTQNS